MYLLCRSVVPATRLVTLIVVNILLFDRVGGKWQPIIGASNVAFEREAWRFGLDLVNTRSTT